MPEDVIKRVQVTFRSSAPLGHSATFIHDGEPWIAYPAAKQARIVAVIDRLNGALSRVHRHLVSRVSTRPDDADRVVTLLAMIADTDAVRRAVILEKAEAVTL